MVRIAKKQKGHAMRSLEFVIRDQITLSVIKWRYPFKRGLVVN
ncbi:hypothetical protein [Xenorhabdus japonica]|nr:hypothetical protein [Xenorhabdus japonica]